MRFSCSILANKNIDTGVKLNLLILKYCVVIKFNSLNNHHYYLTYLIFANTS